MQMIKTNFICKSPEHYKIYLISELFKHSLLVLMNDEFKHLSIHDRINAASNICTYSLNDRLSVGSL